MADAGYHVRVAQQVQQFADLAALWPTSGVTKYWMKSHIVPRIKTVFDAGGVFDIYFNRILAAAKRSAAENRTALVYSIGAGDCLVEISLAKRLKAHGIANVTIIATELSRPRLDRAAHSASAAGVGDYFKFEVVDLNDFALSQEIDVFIAHHTLHHIVNLEGLFGQVRTAMHEEGCFVSADMIGRNGHQRWPETLEWIERIWGFIPHHYKYSYQFNKIHEAYLDWDCSKSGFEGIRAQDVLPLLAERFYFDGFLGYGGVIDPFIERGYGRNIDPEKAEDRAFIDFVETLNQALLDMGRIKPTMMIASMRKHPVEERHFGAISAQFAIRRA